jgi:hypothetical protein
VIGRNPVRDAMKRRAFYATVAHLVAASRRMQRRRDKRVKRKSLLRLLIPDQAKVKEAAADPVKVAVLAIEAVGRASVRACFTGTEIDVAAPDEATASVLREALTETARTRATDRLIRITVS